MANATKKLRFLQSRGNPADGSVIARGATIEIGEPWASRFIADGTAVVVEEKAVKPKDEKPKAKGK